MESSSPQSRNRTHENVEKNNESQVKKPKLHNEQTCHEKNETTTADTRLNWLDLPPDLMVMILMKVGAAEILETVQLVCTSWCKICHDPLTWTCIDMHNGKDSFYTPSTLTNLTMIAVDRSCGHLVDINLEGFGNDELLRYITDRSPRVTHLRLAECSGVSDDGLIEAVSKLPWLTDIDLTLGSFSESAIHVIGRSCPLLKSFKCNTRARRYFPLDKAEDKCFDDKAYAIAGNMPGLHHLMLLGNTLSNDGLQAILDGCSHLVSLDLRCCFNINLNGDLGKRCSEQIKDFRGPWDSTFDYPYETKVENWIETDDNDYYEEDYYDELYSLEYAIINDFENGIFNDQYSRDGGDDDPDDNDSINDFENGIFNGQYSGDGEDDHHDDNDLINDFKNGIFNGQYSGDGDDDGIFNGQCSGDGDDDGIFNGQYGGGDGDDDDHDDSDLINDFENGIFNGQYSGDGDDDHHDDNDLINDFENGIFNGQYGGDGNDDGIFNGQCSGDGDDDDHDDNDLMNDFGNGIFNGQYSGEGDDDDHDDNDVINDFDNGIFNDQYSGDGDDDGNDYNDGDDAADEYGNGFLESDLHDDLSRFSAGED